MLVVLISLLFYQTQKHPKSKNLLLKSNKKQIPCIAPNVITLLILPKHWLATRKSTENSSLTACWLSHWFFRSLRTGGPVAISPLARHPQGFTSSGCYLAIPLPAHRKPPPARLQMACTFGRFLDTVPAAFTFPRGFFAMLDSTPVSFVGSSLSSVAYFCSVVAPAGVAGAFGCSTTAAVATMAAAVSLAWGVRVWGVGAAVATVGARLAICCPCSLSSGSFSFRLALSRAARGRGGGWCFRLGFVLLLVFIRHLGR